MYLSLAHNIIYDDIIWYDQPTTWQNLKESKRHVSNFINFVVSPKIKTQNPLLYSDTILEATQFPNQWVKNPKKEPQEPLPAERTPNEPMVDSLCLWWPMLLSSLWSCASTTAPKTIVGPSFATWVFSALPKSHFLFVFFAFGRYDSVLNAGCSAFCFLSNYVDLSGWLGED